MLPPHQSTHQPSCTSHTVPPTLTVSLPASVPWPPYHPHQWRKPHHPNAFIFLYRFVCRFPFSHLSATFHLALFVSFRHGCARFVRAASGPLTPRLRAQLRLPARVTRSQSAEPSAEAIAVTRHHSLSSVQFRLVVARQVCTGWSFHLPFRTCHQARHESVLTREFEL